MKPWMAFGAGAALAAVIAAVMVVGKKEPVEPPLQAQVVSQKTVPVTETPPSALPAEEPAKPAPAEAVRPARTDRVASARPAPDGNAGRGNAPSTPPTRTTPPNSETVASAPPAAPAPAPAPAPAIQASKPAPVTSQVREPEPAPPAKPAPPPEPNSVTIPAGTLIAIRLSESLSSETQTAGQTFQATLAEPLVADGFVIAERGARVEGKVVEAVSSGRVKGVSRLALELTRFNTSDGQRVAVSTEIFGKEGEQSRKNDATKVAAGAAVGAALGAIFGGGKGAAIGAGSGAAAGTGVVLATRGKEVVLPAETKLSFKMTTPVTVTEKR
ncbi:MAG: hypothetical protein JNL98_25540 [Bryobacterales bacterium]|nr:hypothetical protein [Bryobacterales bacterium]